MQNVTLKSIAYGCLIALCVVGACSDESGSHVAGVGGQAEPDASQGGQGGNPRTPGNDAGGTASSDASSGSGGALGANAQAGMAGEGGAEAAAGATGASNSNVAGEGSQAELPDASDDSDAARDADSDSDAAPDAGVGGSKTAEPDAGPPRDAGRSCPVAVLPAVGDAGVATRSDVQQVLNAHCTLCHSPPEPPMGLDLTDVGAVIGTQSVECSLKLRITSGSALRSYLLDKVLNGSQTPCGCMIGQGMPLDDDPLEQGEIRTIASWINAGTP